MDPRTPVIVGVNQQTQRPDDLSTALEVSALMTACVRGAAEDAGAPGLLTKLDTVAVVYGAWRYSDPGRLIANDVGSPDAKTLLSFHGGNTPQSYVNALAAQIQQGDLDVAVIAGAETIWSRRRMRKEGLDRSVTEQVDVEPTARFQSDMAMSTEFEASRGLAAPINFYPIFESAIGNNRGRTIDEHRSAIAELWAGFNEVAVANPHSWNRTPMTAAEIREPAADNRMVGFPYTKAMNSNWDLDQGAAIILCSAAAAEAAGVPRDRWVFPHAGTDAHDTYSVTNRRDLHSSPAINVAGARLFELTGRGPDDLDHIDLYSCFPSAVQIGAAELGISLDRQLTVTGGLCFAGGPLNNYVSHSIATMVDVLRDDAGSLGLVTANGGYVTKHALGLYSTEPAEHAFVAEDVQAIVDAVPTTPGDPDFAGEAVIEAATVMHNRDGAETGLAAVITPAGTRTWAMTSEGDTMSMLMTDDAIGSTASVDNDGRLLA